jgi:hypothetical protein
MQAENAMRAQSDAAARAVRVGIGEIFFKDKMG